MASMASMEMGRWLMRWKQTEARIAELEKQIKELTIKLNNENDKEE